MRRAADRALIKADKVRLLEIAKKIEHSTPAEVDAIAHRSDVEGLMSAWANRLLSTEYLPHAQVVVDRERAQFAAWYEFFPRSAEGDPERGSKFRDCLGRVDDAKAMGFDVIYFIRSARRIAREGTTP